MCLLLVVAVAEAKTILLLVRGLAVVVEPVDGGMLIHLTQRFQQGTYRDVGPKELYLAMEGNGYRVFGERMLSSTLLKSAPAGGDGIVAIPKDVGMTIPRPESGFDAPV